MAAKGGYNDTVEYLVKEGAHINRKDRLKVRNFDNYLHALYFCEFCVC